MSCDGDKWIVADTLKLLDSLNDSIVASSSLPLRDVQSLDEQEWNGIIENFSARSSKVLSVDQAKRRFSRMISKWHGDRKSLKRIVCKKIRRLNLFVDDQVPSISAYNNSNDDSLDELMNSSSELYNKRSKKRNRVVDEEEEEQVEVHTEYTSNGDVVDTSSLIVVTSTSCKKTKTFENSEADEAANHELTSLRNVMIEIERRIMDYGNVLAQLNDIRVDCEKRVLELQPERERVSTHQEEKKEEATESCPASNLYQTPNTLDKKQLQVESTSNAEDASLPTDINTNTTEQFLPKQQNEEQRYPILEIRSIQTSGGIPREKTSTFTCSSSSLIPLDLASSASCGQTAMKGNSSSSLLLSSNFDETAEFTEWNV